MLPEPPIVLHASHTANIRSHLYSVYSPSSISPYAH